MKTSTRILGGLAICAGLLLTRIAPVSTEQAPPVNVPGIDKPVIVVTGEVTGTETWTNSNYYVLRGAVFVRENATLNIQAGTVVIGEAGSVGTLIVERGGRLNAIGTREQPIVFTSDQPVGFTSARRLGRPHHQRPRAGQSSGRTVRRRRRHRHLRRQRSERQQRHRCATCASSSPASSSAPTTS